MNLLRLKKGCDIHYVVFMYQYYNNQPQS